MYNLSPFMRKPNLRDSQQNTDRLLFKNIRIMKNKKRLRKCHRFQETREK